MGEAARNGVPGIQLPFLSALGWSKVGCSGTYIFGAKRWFWILLRCTFDITICFANLSVVNSSEIINRMNKPRAMNNVQQNRQSTRTSVCARFWSEMWFSDLNAFFGKCPIHACCKRPNPRRSRDSAGETSQQIAYTHYCYHIYDKNGVKTRRTERDRQVNRTRKAVLLPLRNDDFCGKKSEDRTIDRCTLCLPMQWLSTIWSLLVTSKWRAHLCVEREPTTDGSFTNKFPLCPCHQCVPLSSCCHPDVLFFACWLYDRPVINKVFWVICKQNSRLA